MTSLLAQQIVKAYEQLHLDLEAIAEAQELSVTEIKLVLNQHSPMYRKDIGQGEKDIDFTDDDLSIANKTFRSVLATTEDDHLKIKIAKYMRDDKKGRKDAAKGVRNININILTFNEQMKKARLLAESGITTKQPDPAPGAPQEVKETIDV